MIATTVNIKAGVACLRGLQPHIPTPRWTASDVKFCKLKDLDLRTPMAVIDLYTHNFDYIGNRTTGNDGGHFPVAGPVAAGQIPLVADDVRAAGESAGIERKDERSQR